jgi:hypothetical protein
MKRMFGSLKKLSIDLNDYRTLEDFLHSKLAVIDRPDINIEPIQTDKERRRLEPKVLSTTFCRHERDLLKCHRPAEVV